MELYQIVIIVVLAFALAWREARRANLVGTVGLFAIIFVVVAPIADYRFSPDPVNMAVFFSLFVAAMLLLRIYFVKSQQKGRK